MSELLGVEYNGDSKPLRDLSYRYSEGHSHEIDQAKVYSIEWLSWAEAMSLGLLTATKPDRLVCEEMSMREGPVVRCTCTYSGLRCVRRVVPGTLLCIVCTGGCRCACIGCDPHTSDEEEFCGTPACLGLPETAKPEHDGWLEATIELALEAHSTRSEIDDHFGKRALQDMSNWDLGPPSCQADTKHIRFLIVKARVSDGGGVISDSEVSAFRHHGAKCTLPTLAQSLGLNRKAVSDRGG